MKLKVAILKVDKRNTNGNFIPHNTVKNIINEYNEGKYKNKYFEDGSLPVFFHECHMAENGDPYDINGDHTEHLIGKTDRLYIENGLLYADITTIHSPLTTGFMELIKKGAFLSVALTGTYYDDPKTEKTTIKEVYGIDVFYPRETCSFEKEFGVRIVENNHKQNHIGTIEPKAIPKEWTDEDLKERMTFIIGAFTKYRDSDKYAYSDMNKDLCDYVRKLIEMK